MNTSFSVKEDKVYAPNVSLNVNGVPEELKAYPQWVCWIGFPNQSRPGKIDKVPYQVNGSKASTTNPKTWTTFEKAVDAVQTGDYHGVGFVFTKETPFSGVDIDSCMNDGKIEDYAMELLVKLASYTEISPSGSGFHTIVKGKKPGTRSRKNGSHVEIYSTGRFFTITGCRLEGTPGTIEERQDVLNEIYKEMFESDRPALLASPKIDLNGLSMSDHDVISKAMTAKNNEKFLDLWRGDWDKHYSSQSEADSALCFMLDFWTSKNADQMDRLFRASGLYRKKWDEKRGEKTYGQITIEKAIKLQQEVYDPQKPGSMQQKALGIWGEDGNLMADGMVTQEELAARESIIFPRLDVYLEEDNFIMEYMSYATKMSDAYPDYHFALGVTILSIAAWRKFYVDLSIGKIHPNIWAILLGESTSCRKSTALKLGEDIVRNVFGFGLANDFSPESFVEMMANHPRTYLFKDEFAGLLASMEKTYMSDLRDLFCTIYDCQAYHRQLRTSQRNKVNSFDIPAPYLTMAAATTLTSFKEHTQTLDMTSGWLLRYLYFCPDYPKESRPFREAAHKDHDLQQNLTLRLSHVRDNLKHTMWDSEKEAEYFAQMSLEPEALAYFQTWQLEKEKEVAIRKNKTENAIFGRLTIYALKLAMLFTLGRSDFEVQYLKREGDADPQYFTTPVSLAHTKEACRLVCDYFMPTEVILVDEIAANEEKNLQVKIINCLRRNSGKLKQRDLLRQLHMPLKQVGEALLGLKTSEEINIKEEKISGKKTTWVLLKQKGQPMPTVDHAVVAGSV
jgi:putative DNA primase/helicase